MEVDPHIGDESTRVHRSFQYDAGDCQREWTKDKTSLWVLGRSFVTQLIKVGDLTHMSMPALLFVPFSMLESFGVRTLSRSFCQAVIGFAKTPEERMLHVVRNYLTGLVRLPPGKKAYNPVLGEFFTTYTNESEALGPSFCVIEQVAHHPPVSAVVSVHPKSGVTTVGHTGANVKFEGNTVKITLTGSMELLLPKFDEAYRYNPSVPSLHIRNVFFGGKKHTVWQGTVKIVCEKSGLEAVIEFVEPFDDGAVRVVVRRTGDTENPIAEVKGSVDHELYVKWGDANAPWAAMQDIESILAEVGVGDEDDDDDDDESSASASVSASTKAARKEKKAEKKAAKKAKKLAKKNEKRAANMSEDGFELWHDVRKIPRAHVMWPDSDDKYFSTVVWKDVTDAIVDDDPSTADVAKRVVEQRQRDEREERAKGTVEPFMPRFFDRADDLGDGKDVLSGITDENVNDVRYWPLFVDEHGAVKWDVVRATPQLAFMLGKGGGEETKETVEDS